MNNFLRGIKENIKKAVSFLKEQEGHDRWTPRMRWSIQQRSPTFLAPGTGFLEDNFSMDGGGGREDGSSGNASDGELCRATDEA